MPEPATGTEEAQGAAPAPATQAQGAEAQAQGAGADKGGTDVAALLSKIDTLERDNAKYRRDARDAAAAGDKNKTLEERLATLEQENTSFREQAKEASTTAAIQSAAIRSGFRNPELAVALVRAGIEVDEAGEPLHVDRALADLLAREPYLGKPTKTDAGGGPRGRVTPGAEPTTSELIKIALTGHD